MNQNKVFEKIQQSYRGRFKAIDEKEQKIQAAYSKLDSDKQSYTIAEQHKDLSYAMLFDRREKEYLENVDKMLSDRDRS